MLLGLFHVELSILPESDLSLLLRIILYLAMGASPILIALASIFITGSTGAFRSLTATLSVLAAILLGVLITLFISKILSRTILKGLPSSFTLELPPYRKPQIGRIILRSIFDRTLFVLSRAVMVAAPAGLVIWGAWPIS